MSHIPRVQIGQISFRCQIDGLDNADRPWLVFSNSLMTDLSLWDDQVKAFGGKYRILRYDQRGHGGTSVPVGACNFDDLAADLSGLMDSFGIAKAVVAGVSMGGVTALRFAGRYPARVSALVVSDATSAAVAGARAVWQERIDLVRRDGGMQALVKPTIERWFRPDAIAANSRAVERVRAMIAATPQHGFERAAAALMSFDFNDDLARLHCPIRMVAGEGDGVLPQVMRDMAARNAAADFVPIANAGHLPNIEQPAAFNEVLTSFLAKANAGA
jgi:3-oxoadipate enol-lactonase